MLFAWHEYKLNLLQLYLLTTVKKTYNNKLSTTLYLLNEVGSIHGILHFFPAIRKLWKHKGKRT